MNRYDQMAELRRDWQPPTELQRSTPREVEFAPAAIVMFVVAGVLLVAGVGLAAYVQRQAAHHRERIRLLEMQGATTEGTVTRRWRDGGKDDRRRITYQFDYNGRIYSGTSDAPRRLWDALETGTPIEVRFLPSEPGLNHPADWKASGTPAWVPYLIVFSFGILSVVFPLVLNRQKRLVSEGRPAPALVTRYTRAKNGKIVHYEFVLPSGSIEAGKGGPMRTLPAIGEAITVLYDPDNPRRSAPYPMDLVRIPGAPRRVVFRNRRLY